MRLYRDLDYSCYRCCPQMKRKMIVGPKTVSYIAVELPYSYPAGACDQPSLKEVDAPDVEFHRPALRLAHTTTPGTDDVRSGRRRE